MRAPLHARPGVRRLLAALAATVLAVLGVVAAPRDAYAVAGDQIERFDITYALRPDGSIAVQETIDLTFGGTGRHGFERTLVTRERWTDKEDAVYDVSAISVTSPTGAPTTWTRRSATNGSDGTTAIRIGDPDRTVDRRETYVLRYTVAGVVRPFADHDEFSWDATGFEWDMPIKNVTVTVTSPQPPSDVICFAGPPRTTTPCTSKTGSGTTSRFTQTALQARQNITVAVSLPKGAVTNPNPTLEPSEAARSAQQVAIGAAGAAGTAVVAPLLGWLYWRRRGRDDRFVGLAPGTVPARGQEAPVAPSAKVTVPVAFSPPPIPVGEAGLLVDGAVDVRDTTATLIDLAVRGGVTISGGQGASRMVTLRDPSVARAPHEAILLNSLFSGRGPGATSTIGRRGTMTVVHDQVARSLRAQVTQRGWFHWVAPNRRSRSISFGLIWSTIVGLYFLLGPLAATLRGMTGPGLGGLALVLPVVPIVLTIIVVRHLVRRGRRTAVGRAVADQVEGFRTYLATAEANQLRFEEGEDIFSKYLPWAIMFDLADRWARLCEQLVAQGRIPDDQPTWYVGHFTYYDAARMGSVIDTASLPQVSTGSSGSGFGGGSSFGGGGSSGSGGGGGGGSTW